jgi:hypothetical protein
MGGGGGLPIFVGQSATADLYAAAPLHDNSSRTALHEDKKNSPTGALLITTQANVRSTPFCEEDRKGMATITATMRTATATSARTGAEENLKTNANKSSPDAGEVNSSVEGTYLAFCNDSGDTNAGM